MKIIGNPHMQKYFMLYDVFYYAKSYNKQNAKVVCRFDRLRTAHSKRQKAISALEKGIGQPHI